MSVPIFEASHVALRSSVRLVVAAATLFLASIAQGAGVLELPAPPTEPPALPPSPPPSLPGSLTTLQVDCTHLKSPGSKEVNVNGPLNGPNRVETLADVKWESLNPGDTVRLHWRPSAYAEKLILFRSGTAAQPIRVCGVPGGPKGNELPTLTGVEAKSRTAETFKTVAPTALQPYGVVLVVGQDWGRKVEHVIVEGLRVGNTKVGPGREIDADNAFFFGLNGVRRRYDSSAACVRIRQAQHIIIRSNELFNCGDGVFAQSLPDNDESIVRGLLVEGNYFHGNGVIGDESRHQAYLQGVDITVQFNVFGAPREVAGVGAAGGNQLKTRAAGLIVRYNAFENGARSLDMVEAEEHISYVAPWQYARLRAQYLACKTSGCLELTAGQLAQYDARQVADWAKYQAAYAYGNLFHVRGRDGTNRTVPTNVVHYGFDNTQHDRQPGSLWFFHNTMLWETDRDNLSTVRAFDYGSDFGDGGFYGYPMDLRNVDGYLHYITRRKGDRTCKSLSDNCKDWGAMLQTANQENFGRMKAFHNALVMKSFSNGKDPSEFELTRNLWDMLDIIGPTWITAGWDVDRNVNDGEGGGFGRRKLPAANVYPGGNSHHHVTGVESVLTGSAVPIDLVTFAALDGGPLKFAAGPWVPQLSASFMPKFSVTRDPAVPGRLAVVPRTQWSTIGASE